MRTPQELVALSRTPQIIEQAANIAADSLLKMGGNSKNWNPDELSDSVIFHLALSLAIAGVVKMDDDREIEGLNTLLKVYKDENSALRKRLIPESI